MARTVPEKFVNWVTGVPMALVDAVGSYFGASGPDHSVGLVPDPGATPGTTKALFEDGTWKVPASPAAGSITNSQLADMVQSTIKGRAAGAGTGSPQDLTSAQAAAIIDAFTGDSGAGGVKGEVPAPAAGDAAANKFLKADGTWSTTPNGAVTIASGNLTGTNVNITNIPATYSYLVLSIIGASFDTAARALVVQLSTNNGVSFDTTAGNYLGFRVNSAATVANNTAASMFVGGNLAAVADTIDATMQLNNYQGGMRPIAYTSITTSGAQTTHMVSYNGSTSAINALSILLSGSGNFDAGTYALYGIR